jgi:hypothetical protein
MTPLPNSTTPSRNPSLEPVEALEGAAARLNAGFEDDVRLDGDGRANRPARDDADDGAGILSGRETRG